MVCEVPKDTQVRRPPGTDCRTSSLGISEALVLLNGPRAASLQSHLEFQVRPCADARSVVLYSLQAAHKARGQPCSARS